MDKDFNIYINDTDFREQVYMNNRISSEKLLSEQVKELEGYSSEVYKLVAECFCNVQRAAILLSANGMFLKYAGPTIRSNYDLVKIAVNQNGAAMQYASKELLMSDPSIAADLILSVNYGQPCAEFRKVVKDPDYIFEVAKKVVEKDPMMLEWVCKKMYGIESYAKFEQKYEELSSIMRKR